MIWPKWRIPRRFTVATWWPPPVFSGRWPWRWPPTCRHSPIGDSAKPSSRNWCRVSSEPVPVCSARRNRWPGEISVWLRRPPPIPPLSRRLLLHLRLRPMTRRPTRITTPLNREINTPELRPPPCSPASRRMPFCWPTPSRGRNPFSSRSTISVSFRFSLSLCVAGSISNHLVNPSIPLQWCRCECWTWGTSTNSRSRRRKSSKCGSRRKTGSLCPPRLCWRIATTA